MFRNSTLEMPCSVEKVLGKMFTKTLNFMGGGRVPICNCFCCIMQDHFLIALSKKKKKKWKKNSRINGREKRPNNIGATL